MDTQTKCDRCFGTGVYAHLDMEAVECWWCDGKGFIEIDNSHHAIAHPSQTWDSIGENPLTREEQNDLAFDLGIGEDW